MYNEFPSLFPSLWKGGDCSILTGVLQWLSWCLSIFVIAMSVRWWVYHTLLLSLAFLDRFVTFVSQRSSAIIVPPDWIEPEEILQQISWVYCLASWFGELVCVWDVQGYNVNTGAVDDLLCENLNWGIYVIKGYQSLTVSSNQRPKKNSKKKKEKWKKKNQKKQKREFLEATPKATG